MSMAIHEKKPTSADPIEWMQKNYPRGNLMGGIVDGETEYWMTQWKNAAFSQFVVKPGTTVTGERWIIDSVDVLISGTPNLPAANNDIVFIYPEGYRSSYQVKTLTISTGSTGIAALLAAMKPGTVYSFTHNSVTYIQGKLNLGQIVLDASLDTNVSKQITIEAMDAMQDANGSVLFVFRGWKVLSEDY